MPRAVWEWECAWHISDSNNVLQGQGVIFDVLTDQTEELEGDQITLSVAMRPDYFSSYFSASRDLAQRAKKVMGGANLEAVHLEVLTMGVRGVAFEGKATTSLEAY